MKKGSVGQSPFKVGVRLFPFRRTCWLMGLGLVVLILAGLKITLSDTKAAGVTWEVNNGAYSNDSNCNVSLHQCSSIVAAVGTASPGDVISVVAGSGGYDGFIVTTASLTILGPNALYSPVTSSRFSEAQIISKVTIEPGATGVTIQGFEFNRAESWVQIKANNFTLKNNIFSGISSRAIVATDLTTNLRIESNLISSAYLAIEVKYTSTSHIIGNKIGNTSNYIDNGIVLDAVDNLQVSENHLSNLNNQAIKLVNTAGPSSNVTISDNFISRANNSAMSDQGAVQFYGDNHNSVNSLTITNNIIQNSRNGLIVGNGGAISGSTAISNNCFNSTIPTFVDLYHGGTEPLNAFNNYSTSITPSSVGPVVVIPYLAADAITPINNPSIEGDTLNQSVILAQVKNSNGENVANQIVSYKFLNPAGSNPIEGLVTSDSNGKVVLTLSKAVSIGTYDLVLNSSSSNVIFPINRQGCQASISVSLKVIRPCTVNSSGGAGYTSIEPALASACSTIKVTGGGPYHESLVITRPVNLQGPNEAINPNTGVRNAEVNIYLTDGFNDPTNVINKGPVIRILSSNVVIDGFTIDGNNPSTNGGVSINGEDVNAAYGLTNYNLNGAAVGFSNVVVQNNIFKNFNLGAIRWDGISSAVSTNYIRYNRIDNIFPTGEGGSGVYLGDNFYAEVAGNEMLRVHYGIQIKRFDTAYPGVTGSLRDNIIDSSRSGIWYDNSSGFTILNNTLKSTLPDNTNIGLWLTNIQASPGVTIFNNLIKDSDIGIKAWGTASITVNGGSITGTNYGVYLHNYQSVSIPNTPELNTTLILAGVTISDSIVAGISVIDNTTNASNDLTLIVQGSSLIKNGAMGIAISGQDTSLQLNDTAFSGQSGDYIALATSGSDGVPHTAIDARTAKFEGTLGANLTNVQYTALQNKLTDKNDNAASGLVIVYNPTLAVSKQTLTYSDIEGGTGPALQTFTINSPTPSSAPLKWTLALPDYGSGATGWLSCGVQTSGTLEASETSSPISCQVTTGNLAGGTYSATFLITSDTAAVQNSPRQVTVTFNVIAPPVITSQPIGQTIASGQTVNLSVSATSLAPLSYQWYKGTNRNSSTTVGLDSPEFTSPGLATPTTYWVRVINSAGSNDSNFANINICDPFLVTSNSDTGVVAVCGMLSYALKKASLSTEAVTVRFVSGLTGVTLTDSLEPIANTNNISIIIDGGCTTNQDVPGVKLIAGPNSGPIGLRLTKKITVKCLAISGFSDFALSMEGNENQLQNSWLGTLDGVTGNGSGGGVKIAGDGNILGIKDLASSGNHIFGNNNFAVQVVSGRGNSAYYNKISLEKTLTLPLPAKLTAVYVASGGQLKFGIGNRMQVITKQV